MIDPRLMHDQIEAVSNHLGKAVAHHDTPDLAFYHFKHAKTVLEELEREVYWANKRSGEVK